MDKNIKNRGASGVLVILVVLVLLGLGLFYAVSSGMLGQIGLTPSATNQPAVPVKVDFVYNITSITAETIVLDGDNGEFVLPNDPAKVVVYGGPTKESPMLSLTDLKVGNRVNLEFVPGQSATLFVSQI